MTTATEVLCGVFDADMNHPSFRAETSYVGTERTRPLSFHAAASAQSDGEIRLDAEAQG